MEGKTRLPLAAANTMLTDAMQEMGKILIIFGAALVLLGFLLWTGIGAGWLGRLPGDIRIERGHSTFYFPIVTCIILSIVLSLLFSLFRR
jgi:membrane protein implicated in regulation of membrane protease activity